MRRGASSSMMTTRQEERLGSIGRRDLPELSRNGVLADIPNQEDENERHDQLTLEARAYRLDQPAALKEQLQSEVMPYVLGLDTRFGKDEHWRCFPCLPWTEQPASVPPIFNE